MIWQLQFLNVFWKASDKEMILQVYLHMQNT